MNKKVFQDFFGIFQNRLDTVFPMKSDMDVRILNFTALFAVRIYPGIFFEINCLKICN